MRLKGDDVADEDKAKKDQDGASATTAKPAEPTDDLRVHVAYGYYDGATPHFAAEDVIAHLDLTPELRANIEHAYYEAGHMMYVHEPSRRQQSKDLAAFVRRCSP